LIVSASELKLRKHISDNFVGFHFKIRSAFTFERTNSCFLEPFLKTIHAKAVLTLVALKWVHKNPVANSALELFGESFLVDHPISLNRVLFGCGKFLVKVALRFLSRFINGGVGWIFRNKRKVYPRIIIDIDQGICSDARLLSLSPSCDR